MYAWIIVESPLQRYSVFLIKNTDHRYCMYDKLSIFPVYNIDICYSVSSVRVKTPIINWCIKSYGGV